MLQFDLVLKVILLSDHLCSKLLCSDSTAASEPSDALTDPYQHKSLLAAVHFFRLKGKRSLFSFPLVLATV